MAGLDLGASISSLSHVLLQISTQDSESDPGVQKKLPLWVFFFF